MLYARTSNGVCINRSRRPSRINDLGEGSKWNAVKRFGQDAFTLSFADVQGIRSLCQPGNYAESVPQNPTFPVIQIGPPPTKPHLIFRTLSISTHGGPPFFRFCRLANVLFQSAQQLLRHSGRRRGVLAGDQFAIQDDMAGKRNLSLAKLTTCL